MNMSPVVQLSEARSGASSPGLGFLQGGGEMGERIRAVDWAKTSLGPPEAWPQSLQTVIRIMLASRQPVWVGWGPEFIYFYNDSYKSIVGARHPAALGLPAEQVWPETWSQIGPMLRSALGGDVGTYVESHLLIMERNGYPEETYYTWSYTPVPNDDGSPGGIFCANTDDTRRVIGERQLSLLRELSANAAHGRTRQQVCEQCIGALKMNSKDLPFALIYLPETEGDMMRLWGSSGVSSGHPLAPEHIGGGSRSPWPIRELVAAQELQTVAISALSIGTQLSGSAWNQTPTTAAVLPIRMPGQSERCGALVVGLNPFRLFDDNYRSFLTMIGGQVSAALGNADAHDQQRQRAEALAQLDQAKTLFFSNVSHEFRTPLTLMLGPLQDALKEEGEGALTPAQRQRIEAAHRNSLRLLKLVNTLLDFSRIEANRVVATYEPTDIASLTAELASVFRSAVERAGLFFQVECPPLPHAVYVDRGMWEKIVLNLVSNALKFTFRGGIRITVRSLESHVELLVRDTGVGIPASECQRIFQRFYRVRGANSRTREGSGIGLALVKQLVQIHGGDISVHSIEHYGSMFRVVLPFGCAHLPPEQVADTGRPPGPLQSAAAFAQESSSWIENTSVRPSTAETTSAVPRDLVLLADDNSDLREYVGSLIAREFDVISVSDGLAALAAAVEHQPDLVLADVMMPGLDGFGLLRQLRSNPQTAGIPIVLLSARAGEEAKVEGFERGADDYLVKPFGAQELVARIRAHINLAGERAARSALQESNTTLAHIVEEQTTWLALMHEVTRIINEANSWGEALRLVLRRICRAQSWQAGYIYLPDPNDPDTLRPVIRYVGEESMEGFQENGEQPRFARGDDFPSRVLLEGTAQWLELQDAAVPSSGGAAARAAAIKTVFAQPIKSAAATIGVLALFSDLRRAHNEMLAALINDVADQIGKLLERERITTQIADVVWREQQGLLHTLHDSLGQTLTGLGMLSAGLSQRAAATDSSTAELATRIAEQAKVALEQVRQLSRGLFPIEVDAEGLPFALQELAATAEKFHGVRVHLKEQIRGIIRDGRMASQLYRIAQEAVTNAAKHAHARAIVIELSADSVMTRLCIRDDGVGPPKAIRAGRGLGLHIMRYRARSIGAHLAIESAPGGGTVVICTVRQT